MEFVVGAVEIEDVNSFLERIRAIGGEHDSVVQAFDTRYVAGRRHLERAVELADRAIERGENVADDPAVEVLLHAAGRRQIDQALAMGIGPETDRVVVVVHGGDEAGAVEALGDVLGPMGDKIRDSDGELRDGEGELLDGDDDLIAEFFQITSAERAATDADLEELVCERVALLEVEK